MRTGDRNGERRSPVSSRSLRSPAARGFAAERHDPGCCSAQLARQKLTGTCQEPDKLLSPLVAIWKSLPLGLIGVSSGWRLAFARASRMRWNTPLVTTTLALCDSRSSRPTAVVCSGGNVPTTRTASGWRRRARGVRRRRPRAGTSVVRRVGGGDGVGAGLDFDGVVSAGGGDELLDRPSGGRPRSSVRPRGRLTSIVDSNDRAEVALMYPNSGHVVGCAALHPHRMMPVLADRTSLVGRTRALRRGTRSAHREQGNTNEC